MCDYAALDAALHTIEKKKKCNRRVFIAVRNPHNRRTFTGFSCKLQVISGARGEPVNVYTFRGIPWHLLINLKDTFFEPAVGSLPNLARMCP